MDFEPSIRDIAAKHQRTHRLLVEFVEAASDTAEAIYEAWEVAGFRPFPGFAGNSEDDLFCADLGLAETYLKLAHRYRDARAKFADSADTRGGETQAAEAIKNLVAYLDANPIEPTESQSF